MEKRPFFRAAIAGLGKHRMGGYGQIGVYRVKYMYVYIYMYINIYIYIYIYVYVYIYGYIIYIYTSLHI